MKIRSLAAATAAILISSGTMATDEQKLPAIPTLTLEVAKKMVTACEELAAKEGWLMITAVVDRGADLIVYSRMDNAYLGSEGVALRKAKTAARFPFPTQFWADLAYTKDGQLGDLPGIVAIEEVTPFAGGLPIKVGDLHIGGIGVSGDSAPNDEKCAQAGLDAVAQSLN